MASNSCTSMIVVVGLYCCDGLIAFFSMNLQEFEVGSRVVDAIEKLLRYATREIVVF